MRAMRGAHNLINLPNAAYARAFDPLSCRCTCLCARMCVRAHVRTFAYVRVCASANVCVHVHTCVRCTCVRVYMVVYVRVCMHYVLNRACVCACGCGCVCVRACVRARA